MYLGLGVTGSRIPNGYSTIGTLDTRYQPSSVLLRGYNPLSRIFPDHFGLGS